MAPTAARSVVAITAGTGSQDKLAAVHGLGPAELAARLQRMVGFRNIAVHDYQALSLDMVKEIHVDGTAVALKLANHIQRRIQIDPDETLAFE